jgi:DNA-binding beta-propeller fold protein YncE
MVQRSVRAGQSVSWLLLWLLMLLLLLLLLPAPAVAQPITPIFVGSWNLGWTEQCPNAAAWKRLAMTTDRDGNLYLADEDEYRVLKYGPDGSLLDEWGEYGSAPGQLDRPAGIAVDGDGRVFVADGYNDRIQRFGPDGSYQTSWGATGTGPGQFTYPAGLAIDASGNLFVADREGIPPRIQLFTPNGTFIRQWQVGTELWDLVDDVEVGPSGSVYAASLTGIHKYTPTGQLLTEWTLPTGYGPARVAVDSDENVYAIGGSSIETAVYVFWSDGYPRGSFGTPGSGDGELESATGLEVDAWDNVYVGDSCGGGRIQRFGPMPPGYVPLLRTDAFPGFNFHFRFTRAEGWLGGQAEEACVPETLCVSGALPGRSEVFARIVGPKPNGMLWPTLVKFSTATIEAWIVRPSTDEIRYYRMRGARRGYDELPGLFDRNGFAP